ncbi:MAG: signal recognition particle-docking protein FtsY [Candidatus Diapherotrites archaeon]|nr:signal recognition particle-docking protein FtsY [Candidatus Diapherotrites archaeon]
MFDLLKKKIQQFAQKVTEKIVKKEETAEKEKVVEKKAPEKEKPAAKKPISAEKAFEEEQVEEEKESAIEEEKELEKEIELEESALPEKESAIEEEPEKEEQLIEKEALAKEERETAAIEEEEIAAPPEIEKPAAIQRAAEKIREIKPGISIKGKLKAAITGTVELEEKELQPLLSELELALLEADVEQTTAEEICAEISKRLAGKKIGRKENPEAAIKKEIKEILLQMMQTEEIDLLKAVHAKKEKPYKILFLVPNGAVKTTTIAKLTYMLQSNKQSVIWAAADTFRAASIEQLEKHADKLGVRVIKHQYGADPAAVAFDAVKAAEAKKIDVVLIDSAGRQETNRNLMRELEKTVRVIKPDLKIYVGEAFTGQALLQQAEEYDKIVGIDAFILTKIDCDAKGGTTISLLYKMRKPVLFVGTGQEYKQLQKFEPEFILKRVIG